MAAHVVHARELRLTGTRLRISVAVCPLGHPLPRNAVRSGDAIGIPLAGRLAACAQQGADG
jgi:hypothetical protein